MKMKLLELEDGTVSLEFDAGDLMNLRLIIQDRFGAIRAINEAPTFSEIEFGGEKFIYYHEWDPCLMSRSVTGAEMLRQISTKGRAVSQE